MKPIFIFQFLFFAGLSSPVAVGAQSLNLVWGNNGIFTWGNPDDSETAYDMAIDGQDRILVAGTTTYDPGEPSSSRGFVLRLTPTGDLDPTFGIGGVVYIDFPNSRDKVSAIVLNNAGDIFLAGSTNSLEGCIYKLNGSDGSIVASWGTSGRAILPQAAEFNDLLVQPDQKIVAAGWGVVVLAQDADYVVARFSTIGQKDGSFSGGWVNIEFEDDDLAYSIARQSDGKLVVSGESWTCSTSSCNDFSITRLTSAGQVDPEYGKKLFKSYQTGAVSFGNMTLHTVNNEERALISGVHSSDLDAFLFRLRDNSDVDPSFGFKEYTPIGLWGVHTTQGDHKILLAGSTAPGLGVERTSISGVADNTFGSAGVFTIPLSTYGNAYNIISKGTMIFIAGGISSQTGDALVVKINNTNVVTTSSPNASVIGMAVYPNPSAGDINVQFRTEESGTAQLRIFNLTGQLVYETPVNLLPGEEQVISLDLKSQLSAGSYLVQLQTQQLLASKKLVIEQ